MNSKWLTLLEAASYLRVSKETMYRAVKANSVKFYRVGQRKLVFSTQDLDAFITGGNNASDVKRPKTKRRSSK
ncbi:helix-turn-helix domain-containing protein [Candidatus Dependentiae bacterium]|nr:MAG: helix-turn-helix domain-containing protein [Candidatus Dependentiae bacterium]